MGWLRSPENPEQHETNRLSVTRSERGEEGVHRLGELLVDPTELTSPRTGLARLLAAHGSEPRAELLSGQPRAGSVG